VFCLHENIIYNINYYTKDFNESREVADGYIDNIRVALHHHRHLQNFSGEKSCVISRIHAPALRCSPKFLFAHRTKTMRQISDVDDTHDMLCSQCAPSS
jgi:hypothetical protein